MKSNTYPSNEYDKLQYQLESIRAYKASHRDREYHTHLNSNYELVYVEKGYAKHTVDGAASSIRSGDFFIVDADCYHSYSNVDGLLTLKMCSFNAKFLSPLHKCIRIDELVPIIFPNTNLTASKIANTVFHDDENETVKAYFDNIITEYNNRKFGFKEAVRSDILFILLFMIRTTITEPQPIVRDVPTFIINYIGMHFTEKITLTDIAHTLNFSHSSLSRIFKRTFGCSFTLYLQQKRISYSCILLAETSKSIDEIAEAVGYNEVITFRKTFKKHIKMTPSKFRSLSRSTAHCQYRELCLATKRNLTCQYNQICWEPHAYIGSMI